MTLFHAVGAAVAVALFAYLLVALVKPERF